MSPRWTDTAPVRNESGVIELRAGGAKAQIDPQRGGRLASLSVGGRELLLRAPAPDDASIRWGCFLMAPWPGRLADGRFTWDGREVQLPRTHGRHAIHGLGWGRPWRVTEQSDTEAALGLDLAAAGWPPGGEVRERFILAPGSLRLEAEIEADLATPEPAPAALGWHPWFLRRGGVRLRLEADSVLEVERMIPTGRAGRIRGRFDLSVGPELGRRRLDTAFAGVRSPIVIAWPDLELRMSFGAEITTAVVYTPPEVFCVEPQTAPPNAPATGEAAVLSPGEALRSTVTLEWR
jgi:aldose 1-epimerase